MGDRLADSPCTAIVTYEVNPEDCDLFLRAWKRANDFLTGQSGLISNTLHEARSAAPKFRFVNVAEWETGDDFRNATLSPEFAQASGELAAYPVNAAVYEKVDIENC